MIWDPTRHAVCRSVQEAPSHAWLLCYTVESPVWETGGSFPDPAETQGAKLWCVVLEDALIEPAHPKEVATWELPFPLCTPVLGNSVQFIIVN